MEKCLFCNQSLFDGQPTVVLGAKWSNSVNDASEACGSNLMTEMGQCIHRDCRRLFTNPKNIAAAKRQLSAPDTPPVCVLRSETLHFIFKERCFSIDRLLNDGRKRGFELIPVRTMDFQYHTSVMSKRRLVGYSRCLPTLRTYMPQMQQYTISVVV